MFWCIDQTVSIATMQRITEDLLRKKCEHNESDIISVEEISLHQEDIGKIENLDKWCRELKIILLHNNLISKIENLERLKYLEYLNLSINNVEKIENLEGCESLKKLDLTLNFIGELTSVDSLKKNIFLESLFLTGNPCTDYDGYREYVVATLPQLKTLDGTDIMISERIEAIRDYEAIRDGILQQQSLYKTRRERQKVQNKPKLDQYLDENGEMIDFKVENGFWEQSSDNSPETRIDIALKARKAREKEPKKEVKKKKTEVTFFKPDGTPYNTNLGRFPFSLEDDRINNKIVLDVKVPKFLDTNLILTDVQPNYVRVKIKSKFLQLRLDVEVSPDNSKATRSTSTGHLIIEMPKAEQFIGSPEIPPPVVQPKKNEFLELEKKEKFDLMKFLTLKNAEETFADDPDVPPLE